MADPDASNIELIAKEEHGAPSSDDRKEHEKHGEKHEEPHAHHGERKKSEHEHRKEREHEKEKEKEKGRGGGKEGKEDKEVKEPKKTEKDMSFLDACDAGELDIVGDYCAHHSLDELTAMRDEWGWTGLHYAARSGHLEIAEALLEKGFPIDILDSSGSTPLYRATGFGHNELVFYLVENGANSLHQNNQGDNMIHNSAWAGNAELTNFFLKEGVDPLWKNKTNRISLQDITEKLPEIAAEIFNERRRVVSSYLLEVQVEYDFDGIDELDPDTMESTPLEIILQEGHLDLIGHPLIRTLLKFKWAAFAKRIYFRELLLYFLVLALYSYCGVSAMTNQRSLYQYIDGWDYARGAFEIFVLLYAVYELFGEWQEFRGGGKAFVDLDSFSFTSRFFMSILFKRVVNPMLVTAKSISVPRYFFDGWNYVDITTDLLIIAAAITRALTASGAVTLNPSVNTEYQLMAAISILLYFRLLSMLGAYRAIGPLVRSIIRMTIDYAQWLVVYSVFLMGFSIAFFIFVGEDATDLIDFSNFGLAILATFRVMIGSFDWETMYQISPLGLLEVILHLYFLISNIMLLNLLIAMFGNTYGLIRYVAEKEWLMEWASLIMRIQRSLGKVKARKLLDDYLTQQKKDTFGIQNFTPRARVYQSKKFSRWEPKKNLEDEAPPELDIQVMREDIMDMMKTHFESLKMDNDDLKEKISSMQDEIDVLRGKPPKQQTRIGARASGIQRRSAAGSYTPVNPTLPENAN